MANAKLLKEVNLKTGIVNRYIKEHCYYEKELQKNTEKINAMKEDPLIDEYKIKKFNEILQETRSMIPITISNIKKASAELKQLIEENFNDLEGKEQLLNAQREIAAAEKVQ